MLKGNVPLFSTNFFVQKGSWIFDHIKQLTQTLALPVFPKQEKRANYQICEVAFLGLVSAASVATVDIKAWSAPSQPNPDPATRWCPLSIILFLHWYLAALAALYLTFVSEWVSQSLTATLEFRHKEWLSRLQTPQTFFSCPGSSIPDLGEWVSHSLPL